MFNKTIVNNPTKLIPYDKKVTINEHKAPTDESIKLLKEMEEKAFQKITEAYYIESTTINGILFCIESSEYDLFKQYRNKKNIF